MKYDVFVKFTMDTAITVEADNFQGAVETVRKMYWEHPRALALRMLKKAGLNDCYVDVYGALRNRP